MAGSQLNLFDRLVWSSHQHYVWIIVCTACAGTFTAVIPNAAGKQVATNHEMVYAEMA